jgi:predicted transcriptional regulator
MKTAKETEKEFFEHFNSKGTQKVSINLSKELLEMIDELAKITHGNRTLIIEGIVRFGMPYFIKAIEGAIPEVKKDEKCKSGTEKANLEALRKNLEIFKEKYWTLEIRNYCDKIKLPKS